jgi:hypothetical protein
MGLEDSLVGLCAELVGDAQPEKGEERQQESASCGYSVNHPDAGVLNSGPDIFPQVVLARYVLVGISGTGC